VDSPKPPTGFVSLQSIKQGPADPKAALAELRQIYFQTTRRTIEHDFEHAIELLKSLPTEEEREKATVYMEGIAQMRKEWAANAKTGRPPTGKTEAPTGKTEGTGSQRAKRGNGGRTGRSKYKKT
jgi:hypothetical protein